MAGVSRHTIEGEGSSVMIEQTSLNSKWELENGEHTTGVKCEIETTES